MLVFEDAIKSMNTCAHTADHLFLKSLFNNMLVIPHEDKALSTWYHFSSCYNGFVFIDIFCGSFGPP